MLNIKYDPTRKKEQGQYFVELITFDPTDDATISRFGYWCDMGHLNVGVFKPVLHAVMEFIDDKA